MLDRPATRFVPRSSWGPNLLCSSSIVGTTCGGAGAQARDDLRAAGFTTAGAEMPGPRVPHDAAADAMTASTRAACDNALAGTSCRAVPFTMFTPLTTPFARVAPVAGWTYYSYPYAP